ncbi:MAG TPA: nuclear transport factor 2 family protein [Paludibaculum sp.]|jgi:ketosteroid isomerase-like protein
MRRLFGVPKSAAVAVAAIALGACATDQARTGRPDQARTDEIAVRQTLAVTEQRINKGDLSFVNVFADDAVIIAPSAPDIIGFDAIQAAYAGLLKQASMEVHFSTEEVVIAGDLAYERGTYTLRMSDRASGKVLQNVKNKHLHILRRQPSGSWKTWRIMVSSAERALNGR